MMRKRILVAAGLLLVSSAVLADMYQDAKNAELPAARQNLELGTVKSEGGGTGVVTSFYDDYGTLQHRIASNPEANQYAIEQAGVSPNGVTRNCAPTAVDTNCNYVAGGPNGQHLFASGAGTLAQLLYSGAGAPVVYWLRFIASDTRAKLQSWSTQAADADLEIAAKGAGVSSIGNDKGTIAQFTATATVIEPLTIAASVGGSPAVIKTAINGVAVNNNRIIARVGLGTVGVTTAQSGTHWHNAGATGPTTFNLPAASQGLNYCFTAKVAAEPDRAGGGR